MRLRWFLAAGLAVAVALAFFVGPLASGEPDGLQKVAIDEGFVDQAEPHALDGLPTAGYGGDGMGSGLAGAIGVAATFLVAGGLFALVGRAGRSA